MKVRDAVRPGTSGPAASAPIWGAGGAGESDGGDGGAPEVSVQARWGLCFDLHFEDSPQIRFAGRIQTYLVFLSGVPNTRSRPQILCKLSDVGGRNYYMILTHAPMFAHR